MPKALPKILLAEDDKFLVRVMSDKLKRKDFDVILASDGVEAVNKIKSDKPDLVLLDLVMPNKSGFEVLEEIKTDEEFKDLPIIILSNLGQESDLSRAKQLGALDYLIKNNLALDAVVVKIREALSAREISK